MDERDRILWATITRERMLNDSFPLAYFEDKRLGGAEIRPIPEGDVGILSSAHVTVVFTHPVVLDWLFLKGRNDQISRERKKAANGAMRKVLVEKNPTEEKSS